MSIVPCVDINCHRKVQARGMCSTHYSYWHRANNGRTRPAYSKECLHCGLGFHTTTGTTVYCSLICAQRARAGWSASKDIVVYAPPAKSAPPVSHVKTKNRLVCGVCKICDSSFVSFYRDITCSSECQDKYRRAASMEQKHRRRARMRGAFVAPVFRKKVFESDGYRCHICNKMTKKTAVVPHPMAPTIDHLIPLAKGGTHEPINCRTAHFMCNSIKGDRLAGDQLILFAM